MQQAIKSYVASLFGLPLHLTESSAMVKLLIILCLISFSGLSIELSSDTISAYQFNSNEQLFSNTPILTIRFDVDCSLDSVSTTLIEGNNIHSILFSDSIPGKVILIQRSWTFQFNKVADNVYTTQKLNTYKYFSGDSINFYSCLVLPDHPDSISTQSLQDIIVNIYLFFNNGQKLNLYISSQRQAKIISNFNKFTLLSNKNTERTFIVDLKGRRLINNSLASMLFYRKRRHSIECLIKVSKW